MTTNNNKEPGTVRHKAMGKHIHKYTFKLYSRVTRRENLIASFWKNDLHKYIAGILVNKGYKSIIVNGVADHVHIFFGLNPSMKLSDLVRDIKNYSSKFINNRSGEIPLARRL